MIQSMTGYGKAVVAYKDKKINVEVKSLNSKQLDLNTRIAPLYREKENLNSASSHSMQLIIIGGTLY